MKPNLAEIFQNPPILAFRRNKNLRDKLIELINWKRLGQKSILQTKYKVNVHHA